jgi:hypothetical protein
VTVQKSVSGLFTARSLGAGAWQLTTAAAAGAEIFLLGAGSDAPVLLKDMRMSSVGIEWRADGVRVALSGDTGIRHLRVAGAVIHEPQPRLYEALPLAGFDADAQRFWRRVFGLMRVPGGRFLLRFLARRRSRAH